MLAWSGAGEGRACLLLHRELCSRYILTWLRASSDLFLHSLWRVPMPSCKTEVCVLSRFSGIWLFEILTITCQAPLSMGFPRQEYWSGLPFASPGDLPNTGIKLLSLMSPALAGGSLPLVPPTPITSLNLSYLPKGLSPNTIGDQELDIWICWGRGAHKYVVHSQGCNNRCWYLLQIPCTRLVHQPLAAVGVDC